MTNEADLSRRLGELFDESSKKVSPGSPPVLRQSRPKSRYAIIGAFALVIVVVAAFGKLWETDRRVLRVGTSVSGVPAKQPPTTRVRTASPVTQLPCGPGTVNAEAGPVEDAMQSSVDVELSLVGPSACELPGRFTAGLTSSDGTTVAVASPDPTSSKPILLQAGSPIALPVTYASHLPNSQSCPQVNVVSMSLLFSGIGELTVTLPRGSVVICAGTAAVAGALRIGP